MKDDFRVEVSDEDDPYAGTVELDRAGGEVIEHHDDGSFTIMPEFTKEEVNYREEGDDDFDDDHERCHDCAFYVSGGGCLFVQGEIDGDDDYCEDLYADVAFGGHDHGDYTPIEIALWGRILDWDEELIADFTQRIGEQLNDRMEPDDDEDADLEFTLDL